MEPYWDAGGDSGVEAYEYGPDYIRVRFRTGSVYLYTYQSAGPSAIERMKTLARNGNGLNAYISSAVKNGYARRER